MESEKEIKLKTNTGRSTSSEDIKIITNELPINVKREKIVINIQDQEELQISTEESLNPEQLLSRKEVRFNDLLPRNWTFLKDNKTHYKSPFGKIPKQVKNDSQLEEKVVEHFTKYLSSIDQAQMEK